MKTSTKFVISAVLAVLIYTAASFIVLFRTGMNIDGSLTVAYFSFWTAEIVALASIKNAKTNIYKIRIGITHTQESGLMIEALSRIALKDDNITITFITDTIKNLYAMLENFEIDMAIIEEKPTNPDFRFTIIDTDMLVCIVSPQNPVSQKASISLQELKKQHLILRLPSSSTREKFNSALESIGE